MRAGTEAGAPRWSAKVVRSWRPDEPQSSGQTEAEASKDLLLWSPGKGAAVYSLSKPDVFRKRMGRIFLFCLLFCLFVFL